MKDKKQPFYMDSFHTWLYYPSLIKWKIENRKNLNPAHKDYLIYTINSSLVVDLTTFIEGIFYEIQSTVFFARLDYNSSFQKEIFDYFDKKLNNATWDTYKEFFEIIISDKLSSNIENELFKSINILFNFRNTLVHGKEIEIHYYNIDNTLSADSPYRHKSIFDYLKEKNLIDVSCKPHLGEINLLNDQVIDYFFKATIQFIKCIFELLPQNEVKELEQNFLDCLSY